MGNSLQCDCPLNYKNVTVNHANHPMRAASEALVRMPNRLPLQTTLENAERMRHEIRKVCELVAMDKTGATNEELKRLLSPSTVMKQFQSTHLFSRCTEIVPQGFSSMC